MMIPWVTDKVHITSMTAEGTYVVELPSPCIG